MVCKRTLLALGGTGQGWGNDPELGGERVLHSSGVYRGGLGALKEGLAPRRRAARNSIGHYCSYFHSRLVTVIVQA